MDTILDVKHLSKIIKTQETQPLCILTDINFSVEKGASVAIVGKSGTGKTTLLNILAGLDSPSGGEVIVNHQSIFTLTEDQRADLRLHHIGFIFQSFQLLPTLTALENVMLPLEIQDISAKKAKINAVDWLQKVGLEKRTHHYPSQLSGGEQQRVAIARAFINHPSIIYADEMTGNLDQQTGNRMIDLLFELNQQEKITLVLVTHDEVLSKRCEKRYELNSGYIKQL